MQLKELRWFVVLAGTEHVTDAAAELGIAQPTLSRALAKLEAEVGVPLFDRVHRRLRLNHYGQIMAEHARRALAEISSATEHIAALRDPGTGLVRFAFLHSLSNWFVPEQLRRFRIDHPGIRFELFQGPGHEIMRRVRDGLADLAITGPRPDAEFGWHRLYAERLCLAVPHGHRLAGRSRVRLSAAADEPFVALGPDFGLRQLTDELWSEDHIVADIVFEASEIPAMEGLVAAGFGVAVVPVPRAGAEAKVIHVPLTNAGAKREVGLSWSKDREMPPSAALFAAFLKEIHTPQVGR
jgi:LysR family transcriptional regulator, transcription activator of glutamate synthase operon